MPRRLRNPVLCTKSSRDVKSQHELSPFSTPSRRTRYPHESRLFICPLSPRYRHPSILPLVLYGYEANGDTTTALKIMRALTPPPSAAFPPPTRLPPPPLPNVFRFQQSKGASCWS